MARDDEDRVRGEVRERYGKFGEMGRVGLLEPVEDRVVRVSCRRLVR
jgi:hypothetical protein